MSSDGLDMTSPLTLATPALTVARDVLRVARLQLSLDTAAGAGRSVVSRDLEEVAVARRDVTEAQSAALREAVAGDGVDLLL